MIFPQSSFDTYRRALWKTTAKQEEIVQDHADRIVSVLESIIPPEEAQDQVRDPVMRTVLEDLRAELNGFATSIAWEDIAEESLRPVIETVNASFERELEAVAGVQPFRRSREMERFLARQVDENVELIRTLPERHYDRIEQLTKRAINEGWSREQLEKVIPRGGAKARFNAERIARDQVGKVSGQLTERRHRDAGLRKFMWNAVGDSRTRDGHRRANGQIFTWQEGAPSSMSESGYPGRDIQCRCGANVVAEDAQAEFRGGGAVAV